MRYRAQGQLIAYRELVDRSDAMDKLVFSQLRLWIEQNPGLFHGRGTADIAKLFDAELDRRFPASK